MEKQQYDLKPGQTMNLQSTVYTEFEIVPKGGTKVTGSVTANNPMSLLPATTWLRLSSRFRKRGTKVFKCSALTDAQLLVV